MSRWLFILLLFMARPAKADGPADELTVAGIAEFNAAYQTWDGKRFAAAEELFRRATTNAAANVTNYYWLGVARFHRLLQLQTSPGSSTNRAAATAVQRAAIAALTTAVKLNDQDSASHALLGTLYGMKINGNVVRAAWFGPRVAKHRDAALKSGAADPRVQYLLGMCQFHTAKKPAAWREALTTLQVAEKLFATEAERPAALLEPRWGRDSCLTFIGCAHEKLGQRAEAAAYFRKALNLHPQDQIAQGGLARVENRK